jgi:hypothetical protein
MGTEVCSKHSVRYVLRLNVQTDEIALTCPLCDVEAHGGDDTDVQAVKEKLNELRKDE